MTAQAPGEFRAKALAIIDSIWPHEIVSRYEGDQFCRLADAIEAALRAVAGERDAALAGGEGFWGRACARQLKRAEAAEARVRVLEAIAEGRVQHLFHGDCPDATEPRRRCPECPACAALPARDGTPQP